MSDIPDYPALSDANSKGTLMDYDVLSRVGSQSSEADSNRVVLLTHEETRVEFMSEPLRSSGSEVEVPCSSDATSNAYAHTSWGRVLRGMQRLIGGNDGHMGTEVISGPEYDNTVLPTNSPTGRGHDKVHHISLKQTASIATKSEHVKPINRIFGEDNLLYNDSTDHSTSTNGSACSYDSEVWRVCFLSQLKKRNSEILPFLDILKSNPHVMGSHENAESLGLKGNLLELQSRMKSYHRRHRRRMGCLIFLTMALILIVVALGTTLGVTMGSEFNRANDCSEMDFVIQTMVDYNTLLMANCENVKYIQFLEFQPDNGLIELPNLVLVGGDVELYHVGSENQTVTVSIPKLIGAGSVTLRETHVSHVFLPELRKLAGSLTLEQNFAMHDLKLPKLASSGEIRFINMRLAFFSAPRLMEVTSLNLQNCDLGVLDFRALTTAPSIRLSDVGGWSVAGSSERINCADKQYNSSVNQTSYLPSLVNVAGGRIPDLSCLMDVRCSGSTKEKETTSQNNTYVGKNMHRRILNYVSQSGNTGSLARRSVTVGVDNVDYAAVGTDHKEINTLSVMRRTGVDIYNQSDDIAQSAEQGNDHVEVQMDEVDDQSLGMVIDYFEEEPMNWVDFYLLAPNLRSIDSFSTTRVVNMTQLRFPRVRKIREMSIQISSFGLPGGRTAHIYFPNLRSASVINIYQTNNIGVMHLTALKSVDYLTVEFCANLTYIQLGRESDISESSALSAGAISGQSYSVKINMNCNLKQIDMNYLHTSLQGIEVNYNSVLKTLNMNMLTTTSSITVRHNPELEGPMVLSRLTKANIVFEHNGKLGGQLSMPVLTESMVIVVEKCNFTAFSAESLELMTVNDADVGDAFLIVEGLTRDSGLQPNALLSIKDTPITLLNMPSLLSGSDIVLKNNLELSMICFPKLVSLTGLLLFGVSKNSSMYLPELYYVSNITVVGNTMIQNITLPELVGLEALTVVGNPLLETIYLPKLLFIPQETYAVEIVLNEKLCLSPDFATGLTNGTCLLGNQQVYQYLMQANVTNTTNFCESCCDFDVVANDESICEIVSLAYLRTVVSY
eukprot:CFRG2804T1